MANRRNHCRQVGRVFGGVALVIFATLLLGACGEDGEPSGAKPPDFEKALSGAPPQLAALYSQANELIGSGKPGYEERIEELRGLPVVVNVWASWCGPCRAEFPHFQEVSAQLGKRVAFLGVNSDDLDEAAASFLSEHPVPYPSYTDPDQKIKTSVGAIGLPATVFYDRRGQRFTKQGAYASVEDLLADIRRYALGRSP